MLPRSLDRDDAMYIAEKFANETTKILRAQAYIVERRYLQKMLMAAQSYKLVMLKARRHYERALQDADLFRSPNDNMASPQFKPDWAELGLATPPPLADNRRSIR